MKHLVFKKISQIYGKDFQRDINIVNEFNILLSNSLFLLKNRLFDALQLILVYEFNTTGYKSETEFIDYIFSGNGMTYLSNKYECLNHIINNEIKQTKLFILAFYSRLKDDLNIIGDKLLGYNVGLKDIEDVEFCFSDRHADSSTVIIIKFKNNKVIYKPRSLKIDIIFGKITQKINQNEDQNLFININNIDKGEYGWQEFIETKECENYKQVTEYYFRQGINLALLQLLGSTDYHSENIIPHGKYPVLIDLETVFQPGMFLNYTKGDSQNYAIRKISECLYDIGMISFNDIDENDSSAFGTDYQKKEKTYKWKNIDGKKKLIKSVVISENISCTPIFNGKRKLSLYYKDDISRGFIKYYGKFKKLLQQNEFQDIFQENFLIRYVLRATQFYSNIISGSLHPENMVSIDKRIHYIKKCLEVNNIKGLNKVIQWEAIELWKGNVPKIETLFHSKDLLLGKNKFEYAFISSAYQKINKNFKDTITQGYYKKILNNSFKILAYNSGNDYKKNEIISLNKNTNLQTVNVNMINRIYRELKKSMIQKKGSIFFPTTYTEGNKLVFGLVKGNLYEGLLGISLFFGAYFKIYDKKEAYNLCIKSYNTGVKILKKNSDTSLYDGKFGIIYTSLLLADYLNDKSFIGKALNSFLEIDKKNHWKQLDIISGVAGKLLVSIELYKHTNNENVLIYIEKGIKLIVSIYEKYGFTGKYTPEALKKTGFAHGISGIILVLSKYCKNINYSNKIKKIIDEMVMYEDSFYSSKYKNWKDNRLGDRGYTHYSWCYGSSGILLSRFIIKDYINNNNIKDVINNYSLTIDIQKSDSMCHGNLGNLDTLIQYNDLIGNNKKQIDILMKHILFTNKKQLSSGLHNSVYTNGLMVGNSGIGYMLLRYLDSKKIHSILSLDT